jgi:ligand-binding sensor protein
MNKMNLKKLIISFVAALGLSATSVIADGHKYTVDSSNYTEYTDAITRADNYVLSLSGYL